MPPDIGLLLLHVYIRVMKTASRTALILLAFSPISFRGCHHSVWERARRGRAAKRGRGAVVEWKMVNAAERRDSTWPRESLHDS